MRILPLALIAAVVAAPAFAGTAKDDLKHVKMACAGNAVLDVAFINTAGGTSYAVILEQDELVAMKQIPSGSGAIYKAISDDYTYQLLTKGNEATLVTVNGDKEEVVKADCKG